MAQSDGHDAPGLIDELVPCRAAMVDDIVVGFKDAIGEPVVAHKLPDVFDRVEFGGLWRQGMMVMLAGTTRRGREVPAGLIDQEDGMGTGCDGLGDLREVEVHRLGVAGRQDQGRALALLRADRTEDVGRGGALITGRAWAGAALGPTAGDLVLLADTGLVCKPDLYGVAVERLRARDCLQAGGETFLKCSIAPSACAWWRGRAESLR